MSSIIYLTTRLFKTHKNQNNNFDEIGWTVSINKQFNNITLNFGFSITITKCNHIKNEDEQTKKYTSIQHFGNNDL